ncbi:MAG: hypothetical protein VXZ82_17910 [Planctomycetota bacterium]|nr:hypothetical protein [Planctomycetota bacterium]
MELEIPVAERIVGRRSINVTLACDGGKSSSGKRSVPWRHVLVVSLTLTLQMSNMGTPPTFKQIRQHAYTSLRLPPLFFTQLQKMDGERLYSFRADFAVFPCGREVDW